MGSSGKEREKASTYPTVWSPWERDGEYQVFSRHRPGARGGYEYEHDHWGPHESPDELEHSDPANYTTGPAFSSLSIREAGKNEGEDNHELEEEGEDTAAVFPPRRPEACGTETPSLSAHIVSVHYDIGVTCTWTGCGKSFDTIEERDRHHKTIHSNNGDRPFTCTFETCSAGVRSWTTQGKLKAHNNKWHGPHDCPVYGCSRGFPNGFGSETERDTHIGIDHDGMVPYITSPTLADKGKRIDPEYSSNAVPTAGTEDSAPSMFTPMANYTTNLQAPFPPAPTPTARTTSRRPKASTEKLGPNYKVHPSQEFRFGRVFKVLWSEPKGNDDYDCSSGTLSVRETHGGRHFEKVRRFIIVNPMKGHCLCLPLMTYGGQGVLKRGVHAASHAVIHTSNSPALTPQEELKEMTLHPIRVNPTQPRHKLDPMTRLNYAKLYTVEYNVKVWFIGRIHRNSEYHLTVGYNQVHPPLLSRPPPMDPGHSTAPNMLDQSQPQHASNYPSRVGKIEDDQDIYDIRYGGAQSQSQYPSNFP